MGAPQSRLVLPQEHQAQGLPASPTSSRHRPRGSPELQLRTGCPLGAEPQGHRTPSWQHQEGLALKQPPAQGGDSCSCCILSTITPGPLHTCPPSSPSAQRTPALRATQAFTAALPCPPHPLTSCSSVCKSKHGLHGQCLPESARQRASALTRCCLHCEFTRAVLRTADIPPKTPRSRPGIFWKTRSSKVWNGPDFR